MSITNGSIPSGVTVDVATKPFMSFDKIYSGLIKAIALPASATSHRIYKHRSAEGSWGQSWGQA